MRFICAMLSFGFLTAALGGAGLSSASTNANMNEGILARTNLVAWCIVPFDAAKRGPEARARMLTRLGLRRLAYDWRTEHLETFGEEIEAMRRHGIEITAWWFPANLGPESRRILEVLAEHQVRCQLWVTLGDPALGTEDPVAKTSAAVTRLAPIADAAAKVGCELALYNHGGWFGQPENQISILRALNRPNVGLVYNFHHGHEHMDRFSELFKQMQPHLLAINLNGMIPQGDQMGKKILTIGEGTHEAAMIRIIRNSGWQGPVGVLDHLPRTDSEVTLRENLEGLEGLRSHDGETSQLGTPAPEYHTIPAATPE